MGLSLSHILCYARHLKSIPLIDFKELSPVACALFSAGAVLLFGAVVTATYRYFFHPLSLIPGPLLARITRLWLIRVDLSGAGSRKLLMLHRKYGPVVRIGPNEVSFDGLSAYSDIYSQKARFLKEDRWYYGIAPKESVNMFTITDNDVHSVLRRTFSHAFSRSNILTFIPMISGHVDLAMKQVSRYIEKGKPIPIRNLAASYTLDTISKLSFGDTMEALARSELDHPLIKVIETLTNGAEVILRIHIPLTWKLASNNLGEFSKLIEQVVRSVRQADVSDKLSLVKEAKRRMKDSKDGISEQMMVSIASQFVIAGLGTTAASISGILYHVMSNQTVYHRAKEELKAIWPEKDKHPSLEQLESLSYFEACIKEGVRTVCPAPVRMPRVVGSEGYQFEKYYIPEGTVISSSNFFRCYDESVFPDSYRYQPERWLSGDLSQMNASWLPFAKGSRACIGQHMAMIEIKLFVSRFIRYFDVVEFVDELKLHERLVAEIANELRVRVRETDEVTEAQ